MVLKILVVKLSAIGDVIHSLPVVDYLKDRFPDAQIDWVVEKSCHDFLSSHTQLNRVFLADIKKWRKELFKFKTWYSIKCLFFKLNKANYDIIFDLQGNTKSAFITFFTKAREKVGFGWKTLAEKPNFFVTHKRYDISRSNEVRSRYLGLVQAYFHDQKVYFPKRVVFALKKEEESLLKELLFDPNVQKRPRLMVAFGSKWKNKRLADETLKSLLKAIDEKYDPSFFFPYGSHEEGQLAQELENMFPGKSLAIGNLPLPLWQTLMTHVDGVIAMDSAALHLCGTTFTPTFSLFGPSSSSVFKPEGERHEAFQGSCPYGKTFVERCPRLRSCATGACLQSVDVHSIFPRFVAWWERLRASQESF